MYKYGIFFYTMFKQIGYYFLKGVSVFAASFLCFYKHYCILYTFKIYQILHNSYRLLYNASSTISKEK